MYAYTPEEYNWKTFSGNFRLNSSVTEKISSCSFETVRISQFIIQHIVTLPKIWSWYTQYSSSVHNRYPQCDTRNVACRGEKWQSTLNK